MRFITIILVTLLAPKTYAELSFSDFRHAGTGCPQDTVAFSVSPDGESASILFDEFMAQVPQYDNVNDNNQVRNGRINRQSNDPRFQHKSCHLGFTVDVPDGQQVEALEVQIYNRGSTILDAGTRAALSTIFVGHQGMRATNTNAKPHAVVLERKIWGAMHDRNHIDVFDDWISEPVQRIDISSGCSNGRNDKSIRFELKNHLEVEIMNNNLSTNGMIVMDSSDVNASLKFRVITRPCQSRGYQGGGNVRPTRPPRRYR